MIIKKMRSFADIIMIAIIVLSMSGCSEEVAVDYANAESFEAALNNGEDLDGKVVTFLAGEVQPQSAYGYDIWAGEHLNFVSENNPNVDKGDVVTVRITEIKSVLGSWIISYEKLSVIDGDSSSE